MLPRRDLRVNVSRNPCVGIGPVVGLELELEPRTSEVRRLWF